VQAITIMNTQGTKLRSEPTTIGLAWQTWDVSITLPGWHHVYEKLTALFKPRHARQYGGLSFEIRRSMGGSI